MNYREILKITGITEEQVAQAMGYKSAHNMRTSSRIERVREQFVRLYKLLNATKPVEAQNPAPTDTFPPDPCKFLTFYREVATDKIAAVTECPGPAHPGTDDPNYSVLAFVLFGDDPQVVPIPRKFLGKKWVQCDDPAAYKSGADLVKALMPSQSWHKFMEKVNIPNRYDGILSFRLEYAADVMAFTDKKPPVPFASMDNVIATYPSVASVTPCYDAGTIHRGARQILTSYIYGCTVKIDEKTARIVCPKLFAYLDNVSIENISSKKQTVPESK